MKQKASISANQTERLQLRVAPSAFAVIRRAAEIQGRSVSAFVVTAALTAARKTISQAETIRLSREAQQRFVELLLQPPAPVPAIEKAFARPRAVIRN